MVIKVAQTQCAHRGVWLEESGWFPGLNYLIMEILLLLGIFFEASFHNPVPVSSPENFYPEISITIIGDSEHGEDVSSHY